MKQPSKKRKGQNIEVHGDGWGHGVRVSCKSVPAAKLLLATMDKHPIMEGEQPQDWLNRCISEIKP